MAKRQPPSEIAQHRMAAIAHLRPRSVQQLQRLVERAFGLRMLSQVVTPGNHAPLTYLAHSFFEPGMAGCPDPQAPRDAIVWANRGGGKTVLGAVATMLDLLFKPGIEVRILGGSFEQSQKMYQHLVELLDRPLLDKLTASPPTQRRIELINGSCVELLAQSHRSVRGTRVHRLRCDEVEEFREDVWEAAQLVTRSGQCGDVYVVGGIEAMSTVHRPFGLMSQLIDAAHMPTGEDSGEKLGEQIDANLARSPLPHARLFRWNSLDMIACCPPERSCESCVLWPDCHGRAKRCDGFMAVEDLVQQRLRTSDDTWQAEMLCHRPTRRDAVYSRFDVALHVQPFDRSRFGDTAGRLIGGMDFGMRSPLVMIWAWVCGEGASAKVHVVDEYSANEKTLDEHLQHIGERAWPWPQWLGVDPAGRQVNSHSGLSDIEQLRQAGYRVRSRASGIRAGIELIRRRLDQSTLHIAPRCQSLITSMQQYHFDPAQPNNDIPVKDGPDHFCDALRYMLINLESSRAITRRNYLG